MFDLSAVDLSRETEKACEWAVGHPFAGIRQYGVWWAAPIVRTWGLDIVAARAVAALPPREWPIVLVDGPAVATLATTSATALPAAIFRIMALAPERWRLVADLVESEWAELRVLHQALGGEDGLEGLRALAGDDALRAALAQPGDDAARAAALDVLDPSPTARRWHGLLRGDAASGEDLGVWRHAAAALEAERRGDADSAWRWLQHPNGLDAGRDFPDAIVCGRRLHAAARRAVEGARDEWRADPLWPAVEALAAAPDHLKYDGVAHLEAAALLDGSDDTERAWSALMSHAFWTYVNRGSDGAPAREAAAWFASRRGWTDVAALVAEGDVHLVPAPKEKRRR